ncbi:MAG: GPI anchored serine-threonine rich family protein [Candidatus Paceibacterota bacterium]
MDKENFFQDYKGIIIAILAVAILGVVVLMSTVFSSKKIVFKSVPKQTASFKAGEPYTIAWKASNVGRVGIVLFSGDKAKWIAQDLPAASGKYTWNSYPYQEGGTDYYFAVFEYPWRKGGAIAYSPTAIEILGQKYSSCYDFAVEQGWSFLPDSYPNLHKVFITQSTYAANMGGLAGADEICKKEAEKAEFAGNYVAFIGSDKISASERIKKNGIFVEAEPIGTLAEGRTCNRLIAENLQKLLDVTRLPKNLAQVELSDAMYRRLGDVWYGRRTNSTDTKCLPVEMQGVVGAYSGTYTCQDWSINKRQVYYGTIPTEADLPTCYSTEGKSVKANYYGAPAGGYDDSSSLKVINETCDQNHRLMCVEQ